MFSHLSRGYGTWKGIAKLEKSESAIGNGFSTEDLVLPPINKERRHLYEQAQHDHLYRVPRDDFKLPDVVQSEPLSLPKTYSTKSGALLLYSEGCFVPGSRRLRKRPRLKKRKETRLQTLKDLTSLIMEYKKNECDPLLLAHLWRQANNSGRDVRPGFSPKRYLSHLGNTTLDPDSWRKLAETGSLKTLGMLEDDEFLPLLLQDREFGDKLLRQRPQPYTTMSLPPVSPSNSMLGSFTFYKHGMSTGAASMVSMNSDSQADHISRETVGSFVESLSDRLAEVESQSGFKRSYESLSSQEKEDLLTQLLVDVTLHNQGEMRHASPESTVESPSAKTTVSVLADSKSSMSLKSVSKSSVFSSVCSLPPIVSTEVDQHTDSIASGDIKDPHAKGMPFDILSSSSSVVGLTESDAAVGLDGIDLEIRDNTSDLEVTRSGSSQKNTSSSLTSDQDTLEHLLLEALEVQDGETVHQFNDEIKSLKSLGYSDRSLNKSDHESASSTEDLIDETESGIRLEDQDFNSSGFDGDGSGDHGEVILTAGGLIGVTVTEHDAHLESLHPDNSSCSDGSIGDDNGGGSGGDNGGGGDDSIGDGYDIGDGGGMSIHSSVSDDSHNDNRDFGEEKRSQTELNTRHISLSNLQDEARLVVEQVLLRPQSGRLLSEDAQVASNLLMERMEGLFGPTAADDAHIPSADPRKLRPLGRPRDSKVNKKPQKSLSTNERAVTSAGSDEVSRTNGDVTDETTIPLHGAAQNQFEAPELVSSEQRETYRETKDGALNEDSQQEIKLDDIILSADEVKEPDDKKPDVKKSATRSPEVKSETASTERDILTVKDLATAGRATDEKVEPTEKTAVKDTKENVKKRGKGKRGVNVKKGNVAKGKRKKKSDLQSEKQSEPPKTPPFRAGLAPEQKPPKGLEQKEISAETNRDDKVPSETTVMAADKGEAEAEKPAEPDVSTDLQTLGTETRVDSETGEVEEREETPSMVPERSPSPEDASSLDEKTPSPRETPCSPREKTPSPRVETLSPREKTPSPREQASPQVVEESGPAVREPSPEVTVEVDERAERANARAAQRAAAAERRRLEVERKRRDREEARRKAQEEEVRLEQLRQEAEEEMGKREEQRRIRKEQEECERFRAQAEEKERSRQARIIVERQKAARGEWKRKKEQLFAQRKLEEDMRLEREHIDRQLEEERRREYEARIAHLEEEERERLMEERRIEEERIKREIEEERQEREEERRRVLEDRRRMEEEMAALRERQLARQLFLESLLKEYQNLLLEQRTTRAFTFSYFDLLPWVKEIWSNLEGIPEPTDLQTVPEDNENEMEKAI